MRKRFLLSEDLDELAPVGQDSEIQADAVSDDAMADGLENIGVAQMLSALIQDEWKTIDSYKSTVATLRDIGGHDAEIKVLEDVIAEEMTHVGQLEACVKGSAPEAHEIESGKEEAEEQMAEAEHPMDESKRVGLKGRLHESLTYSPQFDDTVAYWMEVAKDEIEYLQDDEITPLNDVTGDKLTGLCKAVAQDVLDSDYLWECIDEFVRDSIREHTEEFQPDRVELNPDDDGGNDHED